MLFRSVAVPLLLAMALTSPAPAEAKLFGRDKTEPETAAVEIDTPRSKPTFKKISGVLHNFFGRGDGHKADRNLQDHGHGHNINVNGDGGGDDFDDNGWPWQEPEDEPTPIAISVPETCESLHCCDTGSAAAGAESKSSDADNTPPAHTLPRSAGAGLPHSLPRPIANGGPYPVRQKAVLPGLDAPMRHDYFAGFLDAGTPPSGRGKQYLHYICAMTPGKDTWLNKPMTIWYNGGPGAPSTLGLFQEFGPYLLTSESMRTESYRKTGIPTPIYNAWTWANVTSVCEIDSPGPMGASFCTEGNGTEGSTGGPSGDPYSCGPWTDHTVAAANHRAYKSFFRDAFPEFETSQQPVSIVGESYAGVYVPLFVDKWLEDPLTGPNGIPINFAGFAVGDGFPACIPSKGRPVDWCADLKNVGFFDYPNALPGPLWDVEFFHGHSQMSESLYRDIVATCPSDELKGIVMPLSKECQDVIGRMKREVGIFHVYNLLEACPSPDDGSDTSAAKADAMTFVKEQEDVPHPRRMLAGNAHRNMLSYRRHDRLATLSPHLLPSPGNGDTGLGAPCLGNSMDSYFSLDVVKRGLGIPLDNNFVVLDNGIGFNYTTTSSFVGPIYKKAIEAGLRILVYEGDTDACGLQTAPIEDIFVPYFGSGEGEWTPVGRLDAAAAPLGLPMTGPWRPFSVLPGPGSGVQGGYVIEWNKGQVSFVSIRGAGHLAPLYRPAASFTMMDAFQKGVNLPDGPK